MFPLIFQSLCVHKIPFVQHFTTTLVCTWNDFIHIDDTSTTCMKYVQKHFSKDHLCALQVFLCALVSRLVCTPTNAQFRAVAVVVVVVLVVQTSHPRSIATH